MSMHVFHDICLHITWHTKDDHPLLADDVEPMVHELLRRRCIQTKGVFVHGIGGTPTHVHLALSIEPFVEISDFVGQLKGASAREINKAKGLQALQWQRGFGVVSFGRKNLSFVLDYIAKQKDHHATGTVHDRLERAVGDRSAGFRGPNGGGNG